MTVVETCMLVVGASVTAAAVALVASELGARARLRARGGYFVLRRWSRTVMEVDKSSLPTLEDVVTFEVNRDGERGPEPPPDADDVFRVLVCGGSAAECYLLDQATAWPAVVQRVLTPQASRLGARRVHVGNIARSLVACELVELMLRRVLPRYGRLDAVVLMVGGSDVLAWLEKHAPALAEDLEPRAGDVFDEHPEPPFGWTPRTMALRRLVAFWHRRLLRPVDRRTGAGRRLIGIRAMRARGKTLDAVPDPASMLARFERWLRCAIETARSKAPRVLVVRQPWLRKEFTPEEELRLWNFGVGRPYSEEVTTYYSHDVVNRLMSAVDKVAARVAEDLGVESLYLMDRLEHDFGTFYDRLHFAPDGAQRVGEEVADAILRGTGR